MSFPNGRGDRFANINNLNSIPAEFDQQAVGDDDLSLFTNTEFFDWDVPIESTGQFPDLSAQSADAFNGNFDFKQMSFPDPQPNVSPQQESWPTESGQASPAPSSPSGQPQTRRRTATTEAGRPQTGSELGEGDPLNVSAEEDKRRRNTAASARFRIKKKQREQAMEKTAKDMTDRVSYLESRVNELEKENKLLKNLLTEKSSAKDDDGESSRKRLKREEAEA